MVLQPSTVGSLDARGPWASFIQALQHNANALFDLIGRRRRKIVEGFLRF